MQTRKFGKTGKDVSALGFGCMRLPLCEDGKTIDTKEAVSILREAIDEGVNYIDTAYYYHYGQSEIVVGEALLDGYREKVCLATKSPVYAIKDGAAFDRILDEQLKRLQTDHIDFYLMHAINAKTWERGVLRHNLLEKAEKAKAAGKIGHIGFSFHDEEKAFYPIVDGYGWDFCLLQLNYLNETEQAGLAGFHYAAKKGLGIAIMEPLLGGRLANPNARVRQLLQEADPSLSIPAWALNYLWDMPDVSVVLSGMSSAAQARENVALAKRSRPGMMTAAHKQTIGKVQRLMSELAAIPCTKCGYCLPCPVCVDIPRNFEIYNELAWFEAPHLAKDSYAELKEEKNGRLIAASCEKCGGCVEKCPQHIDIPNQLQKVHAALS